MDHSQLFSQQLGGIVALPTVATGSLSHILPDDPMEARTPTKRPRKRQLHQHSACMESPSIPSHPVKKIGSKPQALVLGLPGAVFGKEGNHGQRRIWTTRWKQSDTVEGRLDRLFLPHDTLDLSHYSIIPHRSNISATKQPAVSVPGDDSDNGSVMELDTQKTTNTTKSSGKSQDERLHGDNGTTSKAIVQHGGSMESSLVYGHSIQVERNSCLMDVSLPGPLATTRYPPQLLMSDGRGVLESVPLAIHPSSVHPTLDGTLTTTPPHAVLPTTTHLVPVSPQTVMTNRNDDRHRHISPATTSTKCDTPDLRMETPRAICPTDHDSCLNQPPLKHVKGLQLLLANDAQQPDDTQCPKVDCCMTMDNLDYAPSSDHHQSLSQATLL